MVGIVTGHECIFTLREIFLSLLNILDFELSFFFLNVVCFLLGNSPASEFYMPTFRNILSVPF